MGRKSKNNYPEFTRAEKIWLMLILCLRSAKAIEIPVDLHPDVVATRFLMAEISGLKASEVHGYREEFQNIAEDRRLEMGSYFWTNRNVSLKEIDTEGLDRVTDNERLEKYKGLNTTPPFVVLAYDHTISRFKILDGRHRTLTALREGKREVFAYIGVHPSYLVSLLLRSMPAAKRAVPEPPQREDFQEGSGEFWDQEIRFELYEIWQQARALGVARRSIERLSASEAASLLASLLEKEPSSFEKTQAKKFKKLIKRAS